MNWYFSSIIAAITATGLITCFQRLQDDYAIEVYLFYVWLGSALSLGILFFRLDIKISAITLICLVVAGIASWLGNYAYNKGINKQSNLGYIETVSSIRIVIVYCVSLVWFNAEVELLRLIAILGIVGGILLVIGFNFHPTKPTGKNWILWAVLSGIMFASLAIANRVANEEGLEPNQALPIWLFIASILYGSSSIAKHRPLRLSGNLKILILAVVLAVCHNLALFEAYKSAPNLAYPTSINNSRLILLYIVSTAFSSNKLEIKKAVGVFFVFISIILLF